VKPPEGGAVMAELRKRRDRTLARKVAVQNQITRGEMVLKEIVKLQFGRLSTAYRGSVLEHSFISVPSVLAILGVRDSGADARWKKFIDDEAYLVSARIYKNLEKWLRSQKVDDAE
jgi:hypothetical protein